MRLSTQHQFNQELSWKFSTVPQPSREVLFEVNGFTDDFLTVPSAAKAHARLGLPQPGKLTVEIIDARQGEHRKPTISLDRDTSGPQPKEGWRKCLRVGGHRNLQVAMKYQRAAGRELELIERLG